MEKRVKVKVKVCVWVRVSVPVENSCFVQCCISNEIMFQWECCEWREVWTIITMATTIETLPIFHGDGACSMFVSKIPKSKCFPQIYRCNHIGHMHHFVFETVIIHIQTTNVNRSNVFFSLRPYFLAHNLLSPVCTLWPHGHIAVCNWLMFHLFSINHHHHHHRQE